MSNATEGAIAAPRRPTLDPQEIDLTIPAHLLRKRA